MTADSPEELRVFFEQVIPEEFDEFAPTPAATPTSTRTSART